MIHWVRSGAWLLVVALTGCGGESRSHRAGTSARAGGSGASGIGAKGGVGGGGNKGRGGASNGGMESAVAGGGSKGEGGTSDGGANGAVGAGGRKSAGGASAGGAKSGGAGNGASGGTGGAVASRGRSAESGTSGEGGDGGESGSATTPPTKNGVPIGDCTEPTPAEEMAAGCPATEPAFGTSCSSPGLICRYDIQTDSATMHSYRYDLRCNAGSWTDDVYEPCWDSCSNPLGPTTPLDTSDCKSRPITACDPGAVTYPLTPTAQQLTDDSFNELFLQCGTPYNNKFQITLADGCPTSVSITDLIDPTLPPSIPTALVDCLMTALGSLRWACATDLACMVWSQTI